MLLNVHIKNIALIEDANINFTDGLNILTGETGAGKSIIMGALKIGMGGKLPKDMLRDPEKEGFCQLLFFIDDESLSEQLQELDVTPSEDGEIIITRRIVNGRTMNTINDRTVTAAKLKDVSALLVDMHAQHEQQILLKKAEHLNILDKFAKRPLASLKQKYEDCYKTFEDLRKELEEGQMDEGERKRKLEYIQFEAGEIEGARLVPGEDEELEKQYKKMSSSRNILEAMAAVRGYTGNDNGAQDLVGRAVQETNRMLGVDEALQQIASLLQDVESLLSDVNREVSDYVENMTFSEEEFYETEQRLNLLNRLKAKYGSTVKEILACQEEKQKELDRLYHFEQYKKKLEKETQKAEEELAAVCGELSELRKNYGKQLEERIIQGLQDLNFLDVKFEINFEITEHYTANGNDKICFTISTNPGEPLRPLAKVVSGGELSRIMLAIKTILADKDETETLIFDEIDTGISGRTAQKVSEKMAVIGRNHQVICITHLPQIAAMADEHFEIAKKTDHQVTRTQIRLLDEDASVEEIARILGGAQITEHTMESAKEMKELARKKKEEL